MYCPVCGGKRSRLKHPAWNASVYIPALKTTAETG